MADDRLAILNGPTQTGGWLASLPPGPLAALGRLRQTACIEACDDDADLLWLRGPALDPPLRKALRAVLGLQLYTPLSDGQLLPDGARLPCGYAPRGEWRPLSAWLSVTLPATRLAASRLAASSLAAVTLVRSAQERPAGLLVTSRDAWRAYVVTAPQARLARLEFAAGPRRVIVRGTPLPPIPGEFFYLDRGVAAPVGYAWRPAVDADVLRTVLGLDERDVALLWPGGGSSVVRDDRFVGASRSAVRLLEGGTDGDS